MTRKLLLSLSFVLLSFVGFSQVNGDYRSVGSGDWSDPATWEVYNGGWGAATNYPGEVANSGTVTIQTGHTVNFDVDVTAFEIGDLVIMGSGILDFDTNNTWELNALEVHVVPDGLYLGPNFTFSSSQSAFRLPANSFIAYPNGYEAMPTSNAAPNGNCNNNNALYFGGGTLGGTEVKYSACTGGGNVCVTFSEVNEAGGTIRVEPEIELETDVLGEGNKSCQTNFNANIRLKGIIANGQVDLALTIGPSGTVTPVSFTGLTDGGAEDQGPAGDQEILVQIAISVPANNTNAPITYTIVADAELSLISATGGCASFSAESTTDATFDLYPAPSISANAPTSLCLGEAGDITLTNNSGFTTSVYYNVDGGSAMFTDVAGNSNGTIAIDASMLGDITYTIDSIKFNVPPACKLNATQDFVINIGTPGALANDGDTKTQDVSLTPMITASQGCRLIATVENLVAGGDEVDAEAYVDPGYVLYNTRPFVGRRVMLHPTAGGTGSAEITLYALTSEFVAFNDHPNNWFDLPYTDDDPEGYASQLKIIKFDEGDFDPVTGIPTGGSPTEITPTSVVFNVAKGWWEIKFTATGFSLFLISNETFVILPLKLVSFDAKLNGKRNATLNWTTAEERNVKMFDVEASKDGTLFSKVGEVQAKNLAAGANYSFSTAMPGKLGYFRLKMIDKNGAFSYSPIKTLKTDDLIITSYPNPVNDQMIVDLTGYPTGTMRIVDMNGRTLSTLKTVDGINRINTSSLGTGIYILQVSVGLENEKIKFSKVQR